VLLLPLDWCNCINYTYNYHYSYHHHSYYHHHYNNYHYNYYHPTITTTTTLQ